MVHKDYTTKLSIKNKLNNSGIANNAKPKLLSLNSFWTNSSLMCVRLFLACFILSFVAGSFLIQSQKGKAATGLEQVGVPFIALRSSGNVNIIITPTSGGMLASGSHNLTASTNVPTGYNLSLSSAVPSASNPSPTLAPVVGTIIAPTALTDNTWGYALINTSTVGIVNGFDANYTVPTPSNTSKWANPSTATTIKNTSATATDDITTVYYGAKADMSIPTSTHTNTVAYTATANITNISAPSIISITPNSGTTAGGTAISIVGTGFTVNDESVTTSVIIGDAACTNISISSNTPTTGQDTIYCTTPTGNAGTMNVTVSTWGGTATTVGAYTYLEPESFSFTIDTRMTDTLDTAADHYSGTNTTFYIPTSGYVNGRHPSPAHEYDWLINWGDNSSIQNATGTSDEYSEGILHTYANSGEYQITITSRGGATDGWMNAFGFGISTSGANEQSNKNMIKSIDSPIPKQARSSNASYRFSHMFKGARNADSIPSNLFANIDLSGEDNLSFMFHFSFYDYAYNSTTATIPADLFSSINTSSATNLADMFSFAFSSYAYNSTVATIPADIFSSINTSSATNLSALFLATFESFAYQSTVATIPANLFPDIDAPNATDLWGLFYRTFYKYAYNSTASSIVPADLFPAINVPNATSLTIMFDSTFFDCAYNSTTATIPANLFSTINAPNATDLAGMYHNVFYNYAYKSTSATIPSNLIRLTDTSKATNMSNMFSGAFRNFGYNSTAAAIPSDLFASINTSNATNMSNMFHLGFYYGFRASSSITIPVELFATIDTSSATNLYSMFGSTFSHSFSVSTTATLPANLFASIDTSKATNTVSMFAGTFEDYARASTVATIPNNLFDKLNLANTISFYGMFYNTFNNFGFANKSTDATPNTDINNIWGNANFAGKITAEDAGRKGCDPYDRRSSGVFCGTFNNMPSLVGTAQTFINNKLEGIVPAERNYVFTDTSVSDLSSLHPNWK